MNIEQRLFGKRTEAPVSGDAALKERIAKLVADFNNDVPINDSKLHELISDYAGLKAFNEVAGVMADAPALEKQEKEILEYLRQQS